MNSKKFRTFSQEKNKFELEAEFIFAMYHSDGFSERLLHFEIYVDKDYHFYCKINSFKGSVLNPDKSFELHINSILPKNLKEQISLLLSQNFSQIKEKYVSKGLVMSNIESRKILARINQETLNIDIEGDFRNYNMISKNEKRLEKLASDLNLWIETFYISIT